MTELTIDISHRDNIVVVKLDGEMDFTNTPEAADELIRAANNDMLGLVIDLSAVRYVDSAGVRLFFDIARRVQATRQALGLVLDEASPLRSLVRVTKLGEAALLCATVAECVERMVESAHDRI